MVVVVAIVLFFNPNPNPNPNPNSNPNPRRSCYCSVDIDVSPIAGCCCLVCPHNHYLHIFHHSVCFLCIGRGKRVMRKQHALFGV